MKTFGQLRYHEEMDSWLIKCAPHVSTRLKRIFRKINKHQFGVLALAATTDNSRDLLWVLERYPIMCDVLGLKKQQLEGIINPNQELVTKLQVERDYIKELATKFLTDNKIKIEEEEQFALTGS